jgi:hypothetical protein
MTRFGDAYYRIEWLEFTNFDDSNDFALDIDANNIVVANLLFYDYDGGTAGGAIRSSSGTNQTARNCIIYHGQGYGIRIGGGTLSVENCTIYDITGSTGWGVRRESGSASVQNTSDFNGIDGTQSNNISSDATASGTDSLTNVTAYDNSPACPGPGSDCAIFQSIDTGTENLHLRTDADNDALNAGADLSANFTDDIDGDTRPVGANLWDIGADENMQFVTAAVSGTITASTTESDIVSGGKTIIITLTNDTWDADIGQDNAQTTALINGLDSDAGETNGWDAEVLDPVTGLDYTDVTRTSATVVTITLPAFADYNITADETITATVPASALVTSTSAVVAAPTFDVTFDPEITVGSSGTQVLTMAIPSDNQYLGGAFTMIRSAGSANVSEIVLSEISSVDANSDLSDVRLYYETAGTCTYDGDENLLGAGSFDSSEQATISGFVSATLTYDSSDSQQDHARSMVTDTSGNIYVAGFEQTTANGYDWVIRKYGANGDLCDGSGSCAGWGDSDSGQITHNSGGSRNDKAHAIAIDSTNAIYVAGYIGTVSNGDDWAIQRR